MIRSVPLRRTPLARRTPLRVSQIVTGRRPLPLVSRATQRKRDILTNDALFREVIWLRDKGTCQHSGKTGKGLQVAHVFTRSRLLVRWDEDNALLLAPGVHLFWAHKHPTRFHEFIRKRLGAERYNRLLVRSEITGARVDLAGVRLALLQRIAELKGS